MQDPAREMRIEQLVAGARAFLQNNYCDPAKTELKCTVQYSIDFPIGQNGLLDKYDSARIDELMRKSNGFDTLAFEKALSSVMNQTFTDKLISIINQKGLLDTEVYKAADIDRRLYSKIMSDRDYKPSKDTALALIFALELTLPQASDLLSRAGYTLSHSNKRDVILEYFIRESVHNLADINIMLDELGQKAIGRQA